MKHFILDSRLLVYVFLNIDFFFSMCKAAGTRHRERERERGTEKMRNVVIKHDAIVYNAVKVLLGVLSRKKNMKEGRRGIEKSCTTDKSKLTNALGVFFIFLSHSNDLPGLDGVVHLRFLINVTFSFQSFATRQLFFIVISRLFVRVKTPSFMIRNDRKNIWKKFTTEDRKKKCNNLFSPKYWFENSVKNPRPPKHSEDTWKKLPTAFISFLLGNLTFLHGIAHALEKKTKTRETRG